MRGVDRARTKPKPKTRAKGRGPRKILAPSKMVSGGGPVARQGQALRVPLRVPLTRSVGGRSRRSRGVDPPAPPDTRPAPLSPAAPVLPAGPPSAPAPAGRLRCRRLRPLAPGGKTLAPQGILTHGAGARVGMVNMVRLDKVREKYYHSTCQGGIGHHERRWKGK